MTAGASAVNSFAMSIHIEYYWGDDMAYQVEYGLGSIRKIADKSPTLKKSLAFTARKILSSFGVLFLVAAVVFVSVKDRNIAERLSIEPAFANTVEQLVKDLRAGEGVREAFMRLCIELVEYA